MRTASALVTVISIAACSHRSSGPPPSDPATAAAIAGAQPAAAGAYSCFTYSSGGAEHTHATCTTTSECSGVADQVKAMGGMSDVTSCAPAARVWCYHQTTKDGAQSGDVCQPSAEDCAAARKDAMSAQQHVDTDCRAH